MKIGCLLNSQGNNRLTDAALLFLRVLIGTLMLSHGWGKLTNFEQLATVFPDPIGLGSTVALVLILFAEVFCSILIILGLFTRLAAIPLIVGMGVAFFVIHGADPFQAKELAFLNMGLFAIVLISGAGYFSLDQIIVSKCKSCNK
ncbi:MAG: DoxX family protein [Bacteroidales bacterium]|jgi:putative oxidoreductase|nr:DoxX family protein [Bacteroidales bacterium]MDD4771353.1 DoxX family protein [Bacteroidales bacterium]HKL92426.1 DoxX family protein [Bacteroidales bacterium]